MRKAGRIYVFLLCLLCFSQSGICDALASEPVIGTVETTMTSVITPTAMSTESALGNYVADAVRSCLGTDIAIVNGGDFYANLCGGEITEADVRFLFEEDRNLATARISARQLKDLLEQAFSHIVFTEKEEIDFAASEYDGYPQLSGMTVRLDASAPVGERVLSITLDGSEEALDLESDEAMLELAATSYMLTGAYGLPEIEHAENNESLVSVVLSDISAAKGLIQSPGTGRVIILGTNEQWLFHYVPRFALILILLFFLFSKSFSKGMQLERRPRR